MMTESLYNAWGRIEEIPADAMVSAEHRRALEYRNAYAKHLVETLAKGMAHQILLDNEAESVRLVLEEHAIPFPEDVARGTSLDDPSLYRALTSFGPFTRSQP
jgi:hypothetical protein